MTNQEGDWLSIREAAITLGVSELTVRRRIKDGRMPHRLSSGKYFVSLNGSSPGPDGNTSRGANDYSADQAEKPAKKRTRPTPEAGEQLTPLPAEHTRLAEAAGRARALEEQLRQLEKHYQELQQGALSLASRNGWLESKLEEREASIRLLSDDGHGSSWWRRIFGAPGKRT